MLNTRPLLALYEWQHRGNCVGRPLEEFFADPKHRRHKRLQDAKAKAVCEGCPVIAECLAHALRVPEEVGVWGGTTASERAQLGLRAAS